MMISGRILGIDWGMKRIGLSISDPSGILASPLETISAKNNDVVEKIKKYVKEEEIVQIVLGLPLNMDGSEGKSAQKVREFAQNLVILGIPLVFHDERLTSYTAEKLLRESGKQPSRKKDMVDRAAATVLLQDYLDSQRYA